MSAGEAERWQRRTRQLELDETAVAALRPGASVAEAAIAVRDALWRRAASSAGSTDSVIDPTRAGFSRLLAPMSTLPTFGSTDA